MNLLRQLSMLLAAESTIEDLVGGLKIAIDSFENNPDQDNLEKLELACVLILNKAAIRKEGGIDMVVKKMEDIDQASDLMKHFNQKQ